MSGNFSDSVGRDGQRETEGLARTLNRLGGVLLAVFLSLDQLVLSYHQILRDAPGFSHGEVSRCLRSRQSIWCSPQGWDTPGFSHGEEVTPMPYLPAQS